MSSLNLWYQRLPLSKTLNTKVLTETVRRRARIGRAHWDTSFDAIPDTMSYKAPIKGYCMTLEQQEPDGIGLILYGKYGTGKTALAALVLKYCLAKGGRVLSFRSADLIDRLMSFKPQFAPNQAPLRTALANVNYLLIDDLEIEEGTRLRKLESILKKRYDERFPTIITTNKPKEKLFEISWLRSIIEDSYVGIEINGINWRKRPPQSPPSGSIL